MIRFEHVTITYPEATTPTLVDVSFEVPEGELCLVVGVTGSGKSTLLRAVNGLVPRFSGGILAGSVVIDGRTTSDVAPRDLADVVGVVGQDPAAGFVTDFVEDELAYAMENLGVAPDVMRRRVEDILDLLGLHELRHRPLASLSGGQQQRVAIGSVLTAGPRVLVLDEPTSALDPAAAEEVLAALTRLVHDLGITVLIAEHRLERVRFRFEMHGESLDHFAINSHRSTLQFSVAKSDHLATSSRQPTAFRLLMVRSPRFVESISSSGQVKWLRSWVATALVSRRCSIILWDYESLFRELCRLWVRCLTAFRLATSFGWLDWFRRTAVYCSTTTLLRRNAAHRTATRAWCTEPLESCGLGTAAATAR